MHLKANTKVKSLEQLDYILATGWGKKPQQNSSQARQDLDSIHEVSYGLVPSDPTTLLSLLRMGGLSPEPVPVFQHHRQCWTGQ